MSHIFISYSRKDLDFAQKIVDALAANDLDTWIDWQSIPKGEDWEQEIYRGIEEADAFLFLISTDSVASEPCSLEIAHAVKNGKRILPVFIAVVDNKEVYDVTAKFIYEEAKEEINRRNFIFCREEKGEFENAVDEIKETIHADYEWLKYHTQLQNKALVWERKDKDISRLLRGKELREAEEQIVGGKRHDDPQPTNIQREYLLSSRKREDRQRRKLIFGLGIGTLVLLAIAIIAIWQWQIAKEQTLLAQTRELSARALDSRDQHLDLALLLAVEAYNTNNTLDQTKSALNIISNENPSLIRYLHADSNIVNAVAWSSDGRLASAALDTIIWDVGSGKPSKTLTYSNSQIIHISIEAIAWSPNNNFLASGAADGAVIIWDVKLDSPTYGQPIYKLQGHKDRVNSVAWSPDGQLASGGSDNTVIVWELSRGEPHIILKGHNDQVNSVAWSPDGQLASGGRDNTVIVWDLKTEKPYKALQRHRDWITSIAWSSGGQLASTDMFEIILWDLDHARPARVLMHGSIGYLENGVSSIAWSPKGRLASVGFNGSVLIWDLDSGNPSQILSGSVGPQIKNVVAWSPNEQIASGGNDGAVILWEPFVWQQVQTLRGNERHNEGINTVAWSSNGQLASGDSGGIVRVWNIETGQPVKIFQGHTDIVRCLVWSPDQQLASGSDDNTIIMWDIENEKPHAVLQNHTDAIAALSWSPNGQLASSSFDGDTIIWDLNEKSSNYGQPLTILHEKGLYISWSPDGLLAISDHSNISVFDLVGNEMKKIYSFSPYPSDINSITWVADDHLATGSTEGNIHIWDVRNGQDKILITNSSSYQESLSWSPSQKLLAIGLGSHVEIWDITKLSPVQVLYQDDDVDSVAWSEDGRLASGSYAGINIWAFSAKQTVLTGNIGGAQSRLLEPCARAGRNLTQVEWTEYLDWKASFDPEHKTCPQWPAGE